MRNVIRDILTNWRNILGKTQYHFPPYTGMPYSFVVPDTSSFTVQLAEPDLLLFTAYFTYTPIGESERTDVASNIHSFNGLFGNLKPGSTFTINTTSPVNIVRIAGITIHS